MKHGIALIGSTVVDEVLPVIEPGGLTYVDAQKFVAEGELRGEKATFSVGGMATNVAVDLAKMDGGYPLALFGKVGDDFRAEIIFATLVEYGIDMTNVLLDPDNETSSTEVIHFRQPDGSVERIFRHRLGAMGAFAASDINISRLAPFKIAMFGYGLLLPQLDLADEAYGTRLGSVLAATQQLGVKTALDFVSPDEENRFKFLRYRKTIRYVNIVCINEDQACSLTGLTAPKDACIALVQELGAEIGVVHCGAKGPNYACSKPTGLIEQENFIVAKEECKGNAGAGDAFAAGFLHGVHEEWPVEKSLRFAAAAAAISLRDASATGAMKNQHDILNFMNRE
ncbi:carbohydrate kinase family protein [candidate division KSB1 bacterium]|nr:carbohydrate kinase family protein [candidate division KSB1 bacterium]RQW11081.1 MAG: carbohydrate kinase family protein [candidate division KSB1 bacterium]